MKGEGARTPSEQCRGDLEQGAEPTITHIGTCTELETYPGLCLHPYAAGTGSSMIPVIPKWIKPAKKQNKTLGCLLTNLKFCSLAF